jgi:hypothetical protein
MSKIGTGQLMALALLASATLGPAVAQQPHSLTISATATSALMVAESCAGRRRRASIASLPKAFG